MNLHLAARYMGCPQPDERTLALLAKAEPLARQWAAPRHTLLRLEREQFPLPGQSILRHLGDAGEIILLAATLGAPMDECIRRESLMDMSLGLAVNACAAALLEEYLDALPLPLGPGEYATPRFSQGYGDLPLTLQTQFLTRLNAHTIGLHETAGHMLVPEKSVTAVCGITRCPTPASQSCQACSHTDCPYRATKG